MLVGFSYETNEYFYIRDITGNIIHIIDKYGSIKVTYKYDAYGKVVKEEGNSELIEINSYLYKGYYYDKETSLYYCNSRYYDPEVKRFISIDDISYLDIETIGGINLYSYCYNNPVMYYDPSGNMAILVIGLLACSFIVGAGASVVSQGLTYGWNQINYWQVVVDGLFALGSTALAMTGIGALASAGLGALAGWSQYAIGSAFHGEELTLFGSLAAIGLGAIGGAISGAGARNGSNIVSHMKLSGKGASAVKAITTASNRYLTGEISMKGLQATTRLWGNVAFNAVQDAIAPTIRSLMIKGTITIAGLTVTTAGINYGLSYLY